MKLGIPGVELQREYKGYYPAGALGFILRTSLEERSVDYQQPVGTALTLFGDLGVGLAQTRTLTGRELNYRFRTFEVTVPLRNVLLAPASSS